MPACSFPDRSTTVGLAFAEVPNRGPHQVRAVGLGSGTAATHGRKEDRFRFYEISPGIVQIPREHFTYLREIAVKTDVGIADGRLALERQDAQVFDLPILDAFSGDSVPMHLLTKQAMQTYMRHLAEDPGLRAILGCDYTEDDGNGLLSSPWMLVSSSEGVSTRACCRPSVDE